MLGVEEVRPRLMVGLQYRLGGLRGELPHPLDLVAGLADRRVALLQCRELALAEGRELMEQIPQGTRGVGLTVQNGRLGRAEVEVESRHVRTSPLRLSHTLIISFGLCHRDGIRTPM